MLFGGKWTGKRERIVVDVEKAIASVLIKHQHNVIVDDTNLLKSHEDMWRHQATDHNATFEMVRTGSTLQTCIDRDGKRERPVGKAIIHRMALRAGMIDFGEKPIALVDIDGTLADGSHREHHVNGECVQCSPHGALFKDECNACGGTGTAKKNWDLYFSLMHLDKPVDFVVRWVRELSKTHTICVVSARPDTYQFETMDWLRYTAQLEYDYIFMRRGGDKRNDVEVKAEILNDLPKDQINIVLDDRPSVVRMWKQNGVRVIAVRGQIEEF
jgi:hypothetical protein